MRVSVLGSTGSVGRNTCDVLAYHPEEFQVVALAAGSNFRLLAEQARRFRPRVVSIGDPDLVPRLTALVPPDIDILAGNEGLVACATLTDADTIVNAVVGAQGLAPTYAAALSGKRICLANKEALVAGGSLVIEAVNQHGGELLPIDSEHSAIFQCLQGSQGAFSRIYLTASGGPFRTTPAEDLHKITPSAALRHPTWDMGGKITIDSATLMNKGLEVIEAHWLFNADWDRITVVVHPQSIIHSLVEMVDGSIMAQLGAPDMRLPIQVALLHPRRLPSPAKRLHLMEMGNLSFERPDTKRFPSLDLAFSAGRIGGTMPAVLNAANEIAVEMFLLGKLRFTHIPHLVEACMNAHVPRVPKTVDDVLAADTEARRLARKLAGSGGNFW